MIKYDVECRGCGQVFEAEAEDGSLGVVGAKCPHCGFDDDHQIIED